MFDKPLSIPLPCSDFADSLAVQSGLHSARTADMTLIVLVCCVHFPLVPRAVRSALGIHYMHRHALEHIYRTHRPVVKHHVESGYILICMIAMIFDKLGLAALVKPVGLPAEPLCCSTKWLLYYLQAVQWRAALYDCASMDRVSEDGDWTIQGPQGKGLRWLFILFDLDHKRLNWDDFKKYLMFSWFYRGFTCWQQTCYLCQSCYIMFFSIPHPQ